MKKKLISKKNLLYSSLLIVIIIFWQNKYEDSVNSYTNEINKNFYFNSKFSKTNEINLTKNNCEKWIILSSIEYPNDQIKYLRDSSFGWCFLVVAHFKTPVNWEYKDIHYLDIKKQAEFLNEFKLSSKIPLNSYMSKTIGYLYLISKNAKFIYETNDNLQVNDGLLSFKYELFSGLQLECNVSYLMNPEIYFFSQPRNKIKECNLFSSISTNKIPLIQQGIMSPKTNEKEGFNLRSNFPSIMLKSSQYAKLNSENTFYHYDAFWSLIFPQMIDLESFEIVKSFITIRLINEIDGGKIAFQINNAQLLSNKQTENTIGIFKIIFGKYKKLIFLLF